MIIMKSIIIWKFQGKHGGCQVQLPGERKDVSSCLDCTWSMSSSSLYLYHYCVILRIIITITLPDRTWGLSYVPWSPSWSSSSLLSSYLWDLLEMFLSFQAMSKSPADINVRAADMWSYAVLLWELATRWWLWWWWWQWCWWWWWDL